VKQRGEALDELLKQKREWKSNKRKRELERTRTLKLAAAQGKPR